MNFRVSLYDMTALCAQDKRPEDVARWLRVVEKDKVKLSTLQRSGSAFRTLDRKLVVALLAILPKELHTRVYNGRTALIRNGE